jgi:hypothetical protein
MRGMWFDAFHELLARLNMKMDTASAWSLWRRFLSFKHEPVAFQATPGFISVRDLRETLFELMETDPFLSDATFLEFNQLSHLCLDRDHAKKLYETICDQTDDFHGAHNLVGWENFVIKMEKHIRHSHPSPSNQVALGGLWFEPLYRIVIKSMPEVPDRDEVKAHFDNFLDPTTGLLPLERVIEVIARLGRPGLKFEQFSLLVKKLGFNLSSDTLKHVFHLVDLDQSHVMDSGEAILGIGLLVSKDIPTLVIHEAGLSTVQVVKYTVTVCLVSLILFAFVIVAFGSFCSEGALGRSTTWQNSFVQSLLLGGVSFGVSMENSNNFDQRNILVLVTNSVEKIMGVVRRVKV